MPQNLQYYLAWPLFLERNSCFQEEYAYTELTSVPIYQGRDGADGSQKTS